MATTGEELLSSSFAINSVVRGYHVYKDIWTSTRGEELQCQRETGNAHDLYAVSVTRRGNIVRDVSHKFSIVCNLLIRKLSLQFQPFPFLYGAGTSLDCQSCLFLCYPHDLSNSRIDNCNRQRCHR